MLLLTAGNCLTIRRQGACPNFDDFTSTVPRLHCSIPHQEHPIISLGSSCAMHRSEHRRGLVEQISETITTLLLCRAHSLKHIFFLLSNNHDVRSHQTNQAERTKRCTLQTKSTFNQASILSDQDVRSKCHPDGNAGNEF